jgi:para-nitrobenzyl esterase
MRYPWLPYVAGQYVQSLAPGSGGIHPVNLAHEHNCRFWRSLDR